MHKLEPNNYERVKGLIKNSFHELSILSLISGITSGEIYADNIENPKSVLIQTPECNLLMGDPGNKSFNEQVKDILDFWDQVTLDSDDWEDKISEFHKNTCIRRYKRRYYSLKELKFNDYLSQLPSEYRLEKIDPEEVSRAGLENSEKVLEWIDNNWGDYKNFNQNAVGFLISYKNTIVSWSLADCISGKRMSIGVYTDTDFRNRGLAAVVVAAVVDYSLSHGFEEIDWLCVDTNIGSIKTAEKVGFTLIKEYFSYTPYPPIENETDLAEEQWTDWALYFEDANKIHPEFFWESACCWAKANNLEGTIRLVNQFVERGWRGKVANLEKYETFLRFKDMPKWIEFLNSLRVKLGQN